MWQRCGIIAAPSIPLMYNGCIMKIAVCSDLHLEFKTINLTNEIGRAHV